MIVKEVLTALGVLSGAALLAVSVPSYPQDTQAAEGTTQLNLMDDEQAHRALIPPEMDAAQAESEADSTSGVAGRRADDMTGEGPEGPTQNLEEDRPGER